MSTKAAGRRQPGGLRSALQQAQLAADLAEAALRLPPLGRSKPLLYITQLHPVLLALNGATQLHGDGASSGNSGDSQAEAEQPVSEAACQAEQRSAPSVAAAARHLRRLAAVDRQRAANECLLFWLLAVMAQQALGDGSQATAAGASARAAPNVPGGDDASGDTAVWRRSSLSPGDFLLLVDAMGWGQLLAACLELQAPGLAQCLLRHCSDAPCHTTSRHAVLIADVAAQAARQLDAAGRQALAEQPGVAGGPAAAVGAAGLDAAVAAELAHDLELLQQELLAWQSSTAGAAAGGLAQASSLTTALQQLAASADGTMRAMLPLAQQPSWQPSHQHLFQQLCQLRARLAMLLAPVAATSATAAQDPSGREPGDSPPASSSQGTRLAALDLQGWQLGSAPAGAAWQAWQAVLELGQPVGATGHQAAACSTAPPAQQQAGSGSTRSSSSERSTPTCTLPAFLAARVTARALLEQVAPAGGEAAGQGAGTAAAPAGTGSHGAAGPQLPANGSALQLTLEFAASVPALPGVEFLPPALPGAAAARLPEAARRQAGPSGTNLPALALLGSNPDPLSPAKLTLAALHLAQQHLNLGTGSHHNAPAGQPPTEHSGRDASSGAVVHALLWLGQAAAARVEGRQEQRALLECALHGERFGALRRAAERDVVLQDWCRRELLALSNRLADSGGAVKVFGDERQRVATLVREVAPFGLLAPAAAVERLVTDAMSHAGQAGPIAEALAEMGPLAGYPHPASPASTHLADCLYACLAAPAASAAPGAFAPPPTLLDSPTGSQAFLGLARQLCAPRAAAGDRPLVDPSAVLHHAVLPVLRSLAQPKAQQGQQGLAAGTSVHRNLALALQLACALLGSSSGQPPAVPIAPAMGPDAEAGAAASLVLDAGIGLADDAPSGSSSGGGGSRNASLAEQLLPPLLRLLDFSSRQLSASAAALFLPLECYELASALARRVVQLLAWAVAAAAPLSAAAGGSGREGGLAAAARQGATALCSPAPGLLSNLPDAWLHLQALQAALGCHGGGDAASRELGRVVAAAAQQLPAPGATAAARLLQLCAAHPPVASWAAEQASPAAPSAGSGSEAAYAQPLLLALQQLQLPEARQALAAACAATLPVCTPAEAARVLESGLPLAVLAVVGPPGTAVQRGQQQAQQAQPAALQAAALEVACRGVHALALQPQVCPIAGEAAAGAASEEEQWDGQRSSGPSALRQVAVERALRHLSAHCRTLTSAAGAAAAGSGGKVADALASQREQAEPVAAPAGGWEAAGVAAALAVRCFLELSRLAAALQPFYGCATLQVCLLHLVQVLRDQGGGTLPAEAADAVRSSAARLEGGLGETVRFALEEAEESNL